MPVPGWGITKLLSPVSRGDMRRAQGECPTKEGQPWVAGRSPHRSPVPRDGMSFADSPSLGFLRG